MRAGFRSGGLFLLLAFGSSGFVCKKGDNPGDDTGDDGDDTGDDGDDAPPADGPPPGDPLCLDEAQCPGHVSIAHAWGITNPPPYLWDSYAPPDEPHCGWESARTCRAIIESTVLGGDSSTTGPCCEGAACGAMGGMWHGWIRTWWLEGWLPSIGVSPSQVRKAYVVYNRNKSKGGPEHREDCEAIGQLQAALVDAYRQCDTHIVITTHSNGGVTFMWAYRSFIEEALGGANGGGFDQDRAMTCTAKNRNLQDGRTPPLHVNAHLMQAAVGDGDHLGDSRSDFFPIQPYDTVGKNYFEPRDANGNLRALVGIRFYYNHEDVMTYDLDGISTVGRNEVLRWLDGTTDGMTVGAAFWFGHTGQPPFVALHACGHTSGHSSSMGANNSICGDLIPHTQIGSVLYEQACSEDCPQWQDWYDSAQGPGSCLNPCHKNCFGPTGMTAPRIRDPAVYPDKFPFSYGNSNLRAMSSGFIWDGWLDNERRMDWRDQFDEQAAWCGQTSTADEQEPYVFGQGPKFGPLVPGRNDGSGEVPL